MPTPTGNHNALLRLLMSGGMTEQPTERTQMLPLGKYKDGSVGLAIPGAIMDVGNAMFRGMTTDHSNALRQPDPDVRNDMMRQSLIDALTVGGAATTGSIMATRPAGSIGMGGSNHMDWDEALAFIRKHLDAEKSPHDVIGLRVTDEPLKVGTRPPNSYHWLDNSWTNEALDGVSTIGLGHHGAMLTPEDALVMAGYQSGVRRPHGYYYGDNVSIIGGSRASGGTDFGEFVIRDPIVLGTWKKPFGPGTE